MGDRVSAPKCECGWLLPINMGVVCQGKTFNQAVRKGAKISVALTCPQCDRRLENPDTTSREKPETLDG